MIIEVAGEKLYCRGADRVDPARETVVFLHGAGMDHTVWTLPARHFTRHGRNVLVPDMPGHGRSGGAPLASVEAMADRLVALLDALGIARVAVAGHSLGSLVALDVAARFPERVRALAMVGTTVPMPVSDALLDAAARNDHAAFDMLTLWGYSRRHAFGGNTNPGLWMTGGTLRLFERSPPGALHADLSACRAYVAGIERAAAVRCPVLLVLGAGDRLTPPRSTAALVAALPTPRVLTLEGAGHTIMVEAPDALLDGLRTIL